MINQLAPLIDNAEYIVNTQIVGLPFTSPGPGWMVISTEVLNTPNMYNVEVYVTWMKLGEIDGPVQ
tara:strand:+ start:2594 stop:2791 length:198 start_codon:yes stop_codon:yes gene_type:complete